MAEQPLTAETVKQMVEEAVGEAVSTRTGPDVVREPSGEPNPTATMIKRRQQADNDYIVLQSYFSHEEACLLVCNRHGHDARAGRCMRCGSAVSAAEVRGRRRP